MADSAELADGIGATAPAYRADAAGPRRVPAWDWPTRLFKWSLVALVALAWVSQRFGDVALRWHKWNGLAILTLIVFRVLWGFFGSSTARFSAWVRSPKAALRYGIGLVRGERRPYLGHNPLGAVMILVLLAALFAQGVAGLFTHDSNGIFGGPFAHLDPVEEAPPLNRALANFHYQFYWVIVALVAVHVAVNLFYQLARHDPVVAAMVTGAKPAAPYADQPAMRPAPALALRAAACLAVAAALVLGGVKLFGGRIG